MGFRVFTNFTPSFVPKPRVVNFFFVQVLTFLRFRFNLIKRTFKLKDVDGGLR